MIVDDEAPARARLRALLSGIADEMPNTVAAEAANGKLAMDALEANPVDVLLVDIRMPKMGGIELARHLLQCEKPPAVIFVTAYDTHAVEAFELNAIDYLVKPVRAQRLLAALQKIPRPTEADGAFSESAAQVLSALQGEARAYLSCHERGRMLLIPVNEILYLKADLKYVTARTTQREYLLDESLTRLEQEFSERFIRLHRSVLVAREAVAGFEKNTTDETDTQWYALLRGVPEKLPVSRRQWPLVKSYAKNLTS
ncbi:MAG: LytTR family DNA-binding domain-containing protein [Candidatus Accumulibacter sp.]|jgi:two-component system response regulator AlgR|nr:LytTR family DNA-binding domain-containing protein [Accumulibacter sp.]